MALDMTLTPQSELDAVNQMLLSIGGAPVNTLDGAEISDVSFGRYILHQTSREVQLEGWDFNTDEEYTLARDVNGKVTVPTNALSIDPSDRFKQFVERYDSGARRLYDKENRTFVLTDDVKCNVVWFFPFAELPEAARAYIAHRAGRVFQANKIGSDILYRFTKEREFETRAELERTHLRTQGANIFNADTNTAWIARRQAGYRRRW